MWHYHRFRPIIFVVAAHIEQQFLLGTLEGDAVAIAQVLHVVHFGAIHPYRVLTIGRGAYNPPSFAIIVADDYGEHGILILGLIGQQHLTPLLLTDTQGGIGIEHLVARLVQGVGILEPENIVFLHVCCSLKVLAMRGMQAVRS